MAEYSALQQQYIDSVGGMAHMSAVDIIGDAERRLAELVEAVRWERNAMRVFNEACMPDAGYGEITWAAENLEKARAAVDALVGGE